MVEINEHGGLPSRMNCTFTFYWQTNALNFIKLEVLSLRCINVLKDN